MLKFRHNRQIINTGGRVFYGKKQKNR